MCNKIYLTFFVLLVFNFQATAQNNNDIIYLNYSKKNAHFIESEESGKVDITFFYNIFSNKDTKSTTYVFKVDNISENFDSLILDKIKDTITNTQFEKLKILTKAELEKLDPCDLHIKISNADIIYLVKKIKDKYYRYKLTYWSTRRGWEITNN